MKSTKILLAALALGSVAMTGCKDDWAEMNQDPAAVSKGNISYFFAKAVDYFEPQPYLEYYYNAPLKYQWAGWGHGGSAGAGEGILTLTATGDQGGQYVRTLRIVREMEQEMANMSEDDQATNAPYLAATRVLTVYQGIYDTDMTGSLPYEEACLLKWGGPVTPAYDSQEKLFTTWLAELNEAIKAFTKPGAIITAGQDAVYGGKVEKWAKFANSLKLRIAVRLLAQNPTLAKQIASEVESASCGYIDSVDDAVLFNKATVNNDSNDYIYHWFNGFTGMVAKESIINFMVDNLDPRVRFFYTKNSWNSKIVQGYYDAGLEIPEFIEKNVVSEVVDGKKKFVKWGGLGEPWVRYYGLTEDWEASLDATGKYRWYFQSSYANAAAELTLYDANKQNPTQYTTYSMLNRMMIIGNTYTAASQSEAAALPGEGGKATFVTNNRPWYGMYLSGAEVNLYLAEFAMLNNNESKAETHYNKALQLSVQEYDKLAGLNQVAYHSSVTGNFNYDPNEGAIDLKDGEIEAMMAGDDAYSFTGTAAEKLEKIYLQQLIHFTLYPNEVFVTARRSGYPAFNSNILPRPNYAQVPANSIPRRFPTGALSDTDKMREVKQAAFAEQGLTVTSNGLYDAVLATERLWADKNAPAWGAGK